MGGYMYRILIKGYRGAACMKRLHILAPAPRTAWLYIREFELYSSTDSEDAGKNMIVEAVGTS